MRNPIGLAQRPDKRPEIAEAHLGVAEPGDRQLVRGAGDLVQLEELHDR
jgi:hypothetical protein